MNQMPEQGVVFKAARFLKRSGDDPGNTDRPVSAIQNQGVNLSITLQSDKSWLFQWDSTGDDYYRIVLQGRQIDTVVDVPSSVQSYVYSSSGFLKYPPPLEVIPASAGLAQSEINKPYLFIQWYGVRNATYYLVQEFVDGVWTTRFQISEIEATVYSWSTENLTDETSHSYQVTAYNSIDQGSSIGFDIQVVTPPELIESDFAINYAAGNIVFDLAS